MIRLRVKEIAEAKGISQSRMSRIADINIATIRKIWRDPATTITTETLNSLAKALDVTPAELIDYTPDS